MRKSFYGVRVALAAMCVGFAMPALADDWFIPSDAVRPEGVWLSDLTGHSGNEDASAPGRLAGSLLLFPILDAATRYDDNIYRTGSNTVSDFVHLLQPRVRLASDWDNHHLAIDAEAELARYRDRSGEDYDDWHITAGGRVDMLASMALIPRLSISDRHEDREDPETAGRNEPLVMRREVDTGLTLQYRDNPGLLRATLNHTTHAYDGGDPRQVRDRDVAATRMEVRAGYFMTDEITLFVQPAHVQYNFDQTRDRFGINRDARATEWLAGATYDVTEITLLDAAMGITHYNPEDTTLPGEEAVTLRARLEWRPLEDLEVDAGLQRTTGITNLQNAISKTRSGGRIEARYAVRDNVSLRPSASYFETDFDGSGRRDDDVRMGAIVEYYFNEALRTSAAYHFHTRDSSAGGGDFDNNTFMLMLGLAR